MLTGICGALKTSETNLRKDFIMYRKLIFCIAFSAISLFLIIFSLTPQAAQATGQNRRAPQGKSRFGLPSGTLFQVTSAASRKRHGTPLTGPEFDIDMPLAATITSGTSGIETRLGGDADGGTTGDYKIVLTFNNSVTGAGTASVPDHNPVSAGGTPGTATVGTPDTEVIVPLTGVDNEQVLTLHLENVTDGVDTIDVDVNIGFLIGDTTNSRSVNSGDIAQTKAASGSVINSANARIDINMSGSFSSADVAAVKASSGTGAP
jgi:hypothetical protein